MPITDRCEVRRCKDTGHSTFVVRKYARFCCEMHLRLLRKWAGDGYSHTTDYLDMFPYGNSRPIDEIDKEKVEKVLAAYWNMEPG